MALTLDDIKKMSPQKKGLFVFLICLLLGYFYYFYFLQADMEKRDNLQAKLQELEQEVATKERLAGDVEKHVKAVQALKAAFQAALTKLPIREEIPELLHSIALSGRNAGLSFHLFEPQPMAKKQIGGKEANEKKDGAGKGPPQPQEEGDFYEEIPVKVIFTGSYYDTAAFFTKVAHLPRIINVEEMTIGNAKLEGSKKLLLNISGVIKTYMFLQKKDGAGKKADEKTP